MASRKIPEPIELLEVIKNLKNEEIKYIKKPISSHKNEGQELKKKEKDVNMVCIVTEKSCHGLTGTLPDILAIFCVIPLGIGLLYDTKMVPVHIGQKINLEKKYEKTVTLLKEDEKKINKEFADMLKKIFEENTLPLALKIILAMFPNISEEMESDLSKKDLCYNLINGVGILLVAAATLKLKKRQNYYMISHDSKIKRCDVPLNSTFYEKIDSLATFVNDWPFYRYINNIQLLKEFFEGATNIVGYFDKEFCGKIKSLIELKKI
jgi:hypothetical protein